MTSITGDYLVSIIERCVIKTINLRRNVFDDYATSETIIASNEEIVDFIISIPYFDIKLKDFIIGNLTMQAVIISQAWENEFIKKCTAWATSDEWLQIDVTRLSNISGKENNGNSLSLPY